MKQNKLRAKMPETAAFLDAMCEAFGLASIHEQVRKGLQDEAVFYARENGIEIGTQRPAQSCIVWDNVTDCSRKDLIRQV